MAEDTIDKNLLEETKSRIRTLVAEIAALAEEDIQPSEFHPEFLSRVVESLAATAGAIWMLDGRGGLRLQHHHQFEVTGLLSGRGRTPEHNALLTCLLQSNQALAVPPGATVEGQPNAANPTGFVLIIAPLIVDRQVVGLVEVVMDPNRKAATQKSTLRFVSDLCDLAAKYLRNRQIRQIMLQQQTWSQLEAFTQSIHQSLDLKETAYAVVNDGKRLIGCDRVSVALKLSGRVAVEAVSGQEVVEQRSNQIRELNKLCKAVIASGEDLVYTGETEGFPPEVRDALEVYVDESGSKGLVMVLLYKPETDKTKDKVPFGVVIAEQIGDHGPLTEIQAKLEVVARHASSALWNAQEYDKIFLRPMLKSLGAQARLLRGRTWAKIGVAVGMVIAAILAMALVPWTLTVQGDGSLLPEIRRTLHAPLQGIVSEVLVEHGQEVKAGDVVLRMFNRELDKESKRLIAEKNSADADQLRLSRQVSDPSVRPEERRRIQAELEEAKIRSEGAARQLEVIAEQEESLTIRSPIDGIVTTWEVKKTLLNRPVDIGQELIQIADKGGPINLEVQIPDDDMAPVLEARNRLLTQMGTRLEELRAAFQRGALSGEDLEAARLEADILEREIRLNQGGLSDEELEGILEMSQQARARLREMGRTPPSTRLPAYFVTATDPSHRYQGEVVRIASRAELVDQTHMVKVTVGFSPEVRAEFLELNQDFRPGAGVRAGIKCGKARLAYCLFRDVVHLWYETVLFRWPFL